MTISSSTLFNFMKEYSFLKQALENGFWARYCIEPYWNGKHLAIPMLCFCDIPLSQIKEHTENYGEYGIGVTKDFAQRNRITPVTYISGKSTIMNKINTYIRSYKKVSQTLKSTSFEEYILYYIKKSNGKNIKGKNTKFYNEREWRYIPSINQSVHVELFQDLNEANNNINVLSERTNQQRIKIYPKDIAYIFVPTNNEKKKLCKTIDIIYKDEKQNIRDILKTKILSCQQIKEDF